MNLRQTLYQWGAGIFFCLSALTACSDDDTPAEEPVAPQPPTVVLSSQSTSFTTANLQLESANALQCAYLVLKGTADDPDVREVLRKGTQVTANKKVDILLEDLDANTTYKVMAVARGEDEFVSASTQITTQTIPMPEKSHTQIFYYMGDNTGMESELEANLRVIQGAAGHLVRLSEKNQVAIFYDNGKTSTLTQLVINQESGRTEHKVVEQFTQETLSTDPAFMKSVLKKITDLMPADSYGLVLSSHGGGWVPNDLFDKHAYANTRFIGQDGSKYMEIPQLAEALEGMKFEYIVFDACLMSSVEALYTLRKATNYFIASPAEVLASGFPYKEIVPQLFQNNLKGACESFINKYRLSSGTIALIQSDKLDALAAAMKDVLTAAGNKQVDLNLIQGYEGLKPHLFFDLEQYAEALSGDVGAFKAALKEAVIYEAHTSSFITAYQKDPISLPRSCGLSCFIDSGKFPETQAAWLTTEWAKAIGAAQ